MPTTRLTEGEVTDIQRHLKLAMIALDNCMQPDLSDQVKALFQEVTRRAYEVRS